MECHQPLYHWYMSAPTAGEWWSVTSHFTIGTCPPPQRESGGVSPATLPLVHVRPHSGRVVECHQPLYHWYMSAPTAGEWWSVTSHFTIGTCPPPQRESGGVSPATLPLVHVRPHSGRVVECHQPLYHWYMSAPTAGEWWSVTSHFTIGTCPPPQRESGGVSPATLPLVHVSPHSEC